VKRVRPRATGRPERDYDLVWRTFNLDARHCRKFEVRVYVFACTRVCVYCVCVRLSAPMRSGHDDMMTRKGLIPKNTISMDVHVSMMSYQVVFKVNKAACGSSQHFVIKASTGCTHCKKSFSIRVVRYRSNTDTHANIFFEANNQTTITCACVSVVCVCAVRVGSRTNASGSTRSFALRIMITCLMPYLSFSCAVYDAQGRSKSHCRKTHDDKKKVHVCPCPPHLCVWRSSHHSQCSFAWFLSLFRVCICSTTRISRGTRRRPTPRERVTSSSAERHAPAPLRSRKPVYVRGVNVRA
jgi:hypothetical protein